MIHQGIVRFRPIFAIYFINVTCYYNDSIDHLTSICRRIVADSSLDRPCRRPRAHMQTELKYPRLSQFSHRRAIITGAAAGLGRAMALELARDGWTLLLVDQDADGLASLQRETQRPDDVCVLDVTESAKLRDAINDFCSRMDGVDLLVNSAGVGLAGYADDYSEADWRKLFDVNVVAVGCASATVLPFMKKANSGRILNIASAAAYHCLPWLGPYSASKAAVVALTENLVAELADTNIKPAVMISAFFKSSMPKYTLGGSLTASRTSGLMKLSTMTSEDAAVETLKGLERGGTYIIIGSQARLIYRLKRFAPALWFRLAPKIARKAFAAADTAALEPAGP